MLTKCIWCNSNPITSKKNLLCKKCNYYYTRYGSPGKDVVWSPIRKKGLLIKRLIEKYGFEFIRDYIALSNKPYWSLTSMGNKYGITREAIRQIHLKITGRGFIETQILKTKTIQDEIKSMVCKKDPLYKIAEYKETSRKRQGAIIEQLFIFECSKRGIDVEVNCNNTDLRINGYNIEVKSRATTFNPPKSKTSIYQFHVLRRQLREADFFACYHQTEKTFFIIPKNELIFKDSDKKSNQIVILAQKSDYPNAKNRYWEFKDAWHLLQ